ncbi:MAG TPA: hypothetical protein VLB76_26850 [Thermoanaerobaculia bacterium]|nr:hypothetical protein [Thermoanaerobaculia bacterium]
MNIKTTVKYVLAFAVLSTLGNAVQAAEITAPEDSTRRLSVEVYPNSESYVLGELVKLKIRITNRSDQPIILSKMPGVDTGDISVLLAERGGFRKYIGPRWGTADVFKSSPIELAPEEYIETKATLLYHHRMETKHLSTLSAKQITRDYVDTDYAFASPGTYRIKAVFSGEQSLGQVESEPVSIALREPQGDALKVWNALKSDARLGYFIQQGGPNGDPRSPESKELADTLSALATVHPESPQADDIRLSLAKYATTLEKLKERNLLQE